MGNAGEDYDMNTTPYRRPLHPVQVGVERQLLFDDFLLVMAGRDHWDQLAYGVTFSLGSVEKHGGPIFEGDAVWESSSAWLNVLCEGGTYRMWYQSVHKDRGRSCVSIAESGDGIDFDRRDLSIINIDGYDENNAVFEGGFGGVNPEFGNVFRDPNAAPGEEYKMVYSEWFGEYTFEIPCYSPTNGALRGAASPDGIHWTRYYENFISPYPDSQNVACWDPILSKYVAYHRTGSAFAGLDAGALHVPEQSRGRAVGRIESDDFRFWSPSERVLAADLGDGLNTDIYNSAYSCHPDTPRAHYLFPSFYHHYEGTFEPQVVTSRDNRNWSRSCRDNFIPLGDPGDFDCFIISVSPGFVQVDDDTWALYYRSGDGPHGGCRPQTLDYEQKSRVSRVTFKRDRVVGIEGSSEGGHFSTRPISFEGCRLVVNAEPTGPDPELRVQLLSSETDKPYDGYMFSGCRPIREDGLDSLVAWDAKEGIGPEVPRESVRLHFQLRDMRLYAFQFLH